MARLFDTEARVHDLLLKNPGFQSRFQLTAARRGQRVKSPDLDSHPLQAAFMRGIEFEVVWFDQDVIECQVTCSNGPFRGATKIYLAHDDLSRAAETLSGFPSNIKDSRDVQLGAFESPNSWRRYFDEFSMC
jgi:hypothetical protein